MGFRIGGDGGAAFQARPLQQVSQRLEQTQQRLAQGKRIAAARDDAAGLAIAARLAATERSLHQGSRNLEDGQGLVRTAEATMSSTSDDLSRMRELTVQARNGTLSASDRATIQQEYDQLADEIDRRSRATDFAGQRPLDGSMSGSGAVDLHDGERVSVSIDIQDQSAAALGVAGLAVDDPNTLQALDQARDQVSAARASLGATDNRITSQVAQQRSTEESAAAARSRIEDADLAYEMASATRDRILLEANLGVAVQARRTSADSALRALA